jgi:hypothetical protein
MLNSDHADEEVEETDAEQRRATIKVKHEEIDMPEDYDDSDLNDEERFF